MRALHTAATGMMAQELNVQVISNNIANMRTTGYKRQRAEFQDLLYEHVRRIGTQTSTQGNIQPVGVDLGQAGIDLAHVLRIGGLDLAQKPVALHVGGQHRIEQRHGAGWMFLVDRADARGLGQADLAAADEQAVLRLWEGLGYYRRARDLHRSAIRIVAEHGGNLPDDPAVAAAAPAEEPENEEAARLRTASPSGSAGTAPAAGFVSA